jgi:hypothetical protein
MDSNAKFGSVRVSCEGYDYDADPFILAGSCGVCVGFLKSLEIESTLFQFFLFQVGIYN